MNPQSLLRSKIQEAYNQSRLVNPSLSQRAFAKRLNLSSGALSALLAAKRKASRKLAVRIAEALLLKPEEILEIERSFSGEIQSNIKAPVEYLQMDSDTHELISGWVHYAVLSMVKMKSFKEDPEWIAGRLGVSTLEATRAIDRLLRLKLLKRSPTGRLKRSSVRISTSDGIFSSSLRRAHVSNLELARYSLISDPIEIRDFSTITMAIDPKKLESARKKIRDFQDSLSDYLEQGEQSEVYRLCMQLFPMTRSFKKGDSSL